MKIQAVSRRNNGKNKVLRDWLCVGAWFGALGALLYGLNIYMFPLNHLFATTYIERVEIGDRTLETIVKDIVAQVEAQRWGGRKLSIIFSPPGLANIRRDETVGAAYGNRPIAGQAEDALYVLSCDFYCHYRFIGDNTILFYADEGYPQKRSQPHQK